MKRNPLSSCSIVSQICTQIAISFLTFQLVQFCVYTENVFQLVQVCRLAFAWLDVIDFRFTHFIALRAISIRNIELLNLNCDSLLRLLLCIECLKIGSCSNWIKVSWFVVSGRSWNYLVIGCQETNIYVITRCRWVMFRWWGFC